jgi:hypothetical protein
LVGCLIHAPARLVDVDVHPFLDPLQVRVPDVAGDFAGPDERGPIAAHLLALACALGLMTVGLMPWGVALIALLLAIRAGWDLRPGAPAETAMRIGVRELVTGVVAAGAMGAAWAVAMRP